MFSLALELSSYINAEASELCVLPSPVFLLLKLLTVDFQFAGEGGGLFDLLSAQPSMRSIFVILTCSDR